MPSFGLAQTPEKSGMATALCVLLLVGSVVCPQAGIAIATAANTTNKRKSGRCDFIVSSIVVRLRGPLLNLGNEQNTFCRRPIALCDLDAQKGIFVAWFDYKPHIPKAAS